MAINLSNLIDVGGKTITSGIASNLDTAALIENLTTIKRLPAQTLEDKIEINKEKLAAYGSLRSFLDAFKTASNFLRKPAGTNNISSNAFEFRTATLLSNTSVAASTYLSASASPGAFLGNFDVQIGNVAQAKSIRSTSFTTQTASVTETPVGHITTMDFGANAPSPGVQSVGSFDFSGGDIAPADTLTIGAHTFTFITNGTPSSGLNIEVGLTNDATVTEIARYLNDAATQASYTDVGKFSFADSGPDLTITAHDAGTANDAIGLSAVIAADGANGSPVDTAGGVDADTFSIGGATFTFGFNGTASLDDVVETGATITETAQNIADHLNSVNGQAVHADVPKFTYTASGTKVTATSTTIGGADDALDFAGTIAAGAPTITSVPGVAGTTAGLFSTGTFQFTTTANTALSDTLVTADYSVAGSAVGILTAAGIHNIVAPAAGGSTALKGVVSGFSATWTAGTPNTVDLSVTVNGTVFSVTGLDATQGDGGQIAAGVITLSDGAGTSFDIELSAAVNADDQTEANAFASALDTALAPQTVLQTRELGNFDSSKISTVFSGLSRSDAVLTSGAFATDGTHGSLGAFTVNAVSGVGIMDGSITVVIDGETYTASGLGTDTDDTHTANITLTSTDPNKTLTLNIADAGVTLDFSSATTAQAIEDELNSIFATNVTNITVNDDDSLVDIAAAINSQTVSSGIAASIIQVSDTDFRLNIKSNKEGINNSFSIVDSSGVLTEASFTTQQAAEDALITVDGVTIKRTTNTISDVVSGVTLSLITETPNFGGGSPTTITTSIGRDTATAAAGVVNFINAYNDFRVFAADQTRREENGEYTEDALLGGDTTLQTLINQIGTEITRIVGGVSNTDFSALSNLGLSLTDFEGDDTTGETTNILTYDEDKLNGFLATNFEDVRKVFEFTFSANSSDLAIFSRTNALALTDFKLDIDTSRTGDEVRVLDSDDVFLYNATLSGNKLSGVSGTGLEGLVMIYTGDGTDIITVNATHGISDRIYNITEDAVKTQGVIDKAVEFTNNEDTRFTDEITKIDRQIEIFRDTLIAQYAALEKAISTVNTILQFIEARNNFIFNNNN